MRKTKKNRPTPNSLLSLNTSSALAEQCRIVLNNIKFTTINKPIKLIAVTSSNQGEGKSTIAANLAVVASENQQRVLLVDCDMRSPTVGMTFILTNTIGLSNYLTEPESNLNDFIQSSDINNLNILASGPKPPNPSELLSSNRMKQFINTDCNSFDFVIFDCPPVLGMTDTQVIASEADAVLLVARENFTKKENLFRAKDSLQLSEANILGVAYNGITKKDTAYYYY